MDTIKKFLNLKRDEDIDQPTKYVKLYLTKCIILSKNFSTIQHLFLFVIDFSNNGVGIAFRK